MGEHRVPTPRKYSDRYTPPSLPPPRSSFLSLSCSVLRRAVPLLLPFTVLFLFRAVTSAKLRRAASRANFASSSSRPTSEFWNAFERKNSERARARARKRRECLPARLRGRTSTRIPPFCRTARRYVYLSPSLPAFRKIYAIIHHIDSRSLLLHIFLSRGGAELLREAEESLSFARGDAMNDALSLFIAQSISHNIINRMGERLAVSDITMSRNLTILSRA